MWWEYYAPMYVNGKIRSVETIPGMEGGDKENDQGGEFNYDKW
jgi:hypothetical protein